VRSINAPSASEITQNHMICSLSLRKNAVSDETLSARSWIVVIKSA
jgi:hypothetical protein